MTKLRDRARCSPFPWVAVAACIGIACAASSQKPAVDAALANDELRRESLLQNTAQALSDDALSRLTARRLADHPEGLRQLMIATLDEVSDEPAPLGAVSEAIRERPQIAATVLVQREESVRRTLKALMARSKRTCAPSARWASRPERTNSRPW